MFYYLSVPHNVCVVCAVLKRRKTLMPDAGLLLEHVVLHVLCLSFELKKKGLRPLLLNKASH